MEGVLSEGMCRCCASEGSFKDFQVPYQWMGVEEIYSNMMKDCFDISLMVTEDGNNGGICEVCITQLRNAFNFKLQVQQTELKFKRKLEERSFKADSIKMELSRDGDDDSNMSGDFSSNDYEVPIKVEKVEDKPKKRQAAKASTSKAKKSKASPGETSTKHTSGIRIHKKSFITLVVPKKTPKLTVVKGKKKEQIAYQENIKDILFHTNATPIRCRGGIGYACSFCTNQYPDASDLKEHTIKEHDEKTKSAFMKEVQLDDFIVKLDITHLKCICGISLDNKEDMMEHLKEKHNKLFHNNFSKHVVPFKFEKQLQCAICSLNFNNFKLLMEHMNVHFGNHVCEVCGSGFINKRTLRTHCYRHKTGDYPCRYCAKIFDTNIKKLEHERAVHVHGNRRNKCGYCGEKFTDYTKKNDHEVKLHGATPLVLNCQACDKVFSNQRSLTIHSKTYHMMQRRK